MARRVQQTNDSFKNIFLPAHSLDRAEIGLNLIVLDERSGLPLIFVQPDSDGLLLIIFPLIKGAPTPIANPFYPWGMEKNMEHRPAVLAGPPAGEAPY
jgi:hypothetical protein